MSRGLVSLWETMLGLRYRRHCGVIGPPPLRGGGWCPLTQTTPSPAKEGERVNALRAFKDAKRVAGMGYGIFVPTSGERQSNQLVLSS